VNQDLLWQLPQHFLVSLLSLSSFSAIFYFLLCFFTLFFWGGVLLASTPKAKDKQQHFQKGWEQKEKEEGLAQR
jgi:hypothetical protein